METIPLNQKDRRRCNVLNKLRGDEISLDDACSLLNLSRRHVLRLLGRLRREGMDTLVHGNRGRVPANKTPEEVVTTIRELLGPDGPYHDFNICHAQEILASRHGIKIGRSTLQRLVGTWGLRQPHKQRARRVFCRRPRCARRGEMLLIDGSPYDWLEGRDGSGKPICLIGAVDDATGEVVHMSFWPSECLEAYTLMVRQIVRTLGRPGCFYHDRHTILCSPGKPTLEDELADEAPMSQFERMLSSAGISSIKAHTPQAKGRIERLWGVLQDRLVREMRLAAITTMEAANAYLAEFVPRYNAQFAVGPQDAKNAYLPADGLDEGYVFAVRTRRVVRRDHTIRYNGTILQILPSAGQRSLADEAVYVHVTPEGECYLYDGEERLRYKVVAPKPAPAPQPPPPPLPKDQPPARRRKPSDNPGTRAWLFGKKR